MKKLFTSLVILFCLGVSSFAFDGIMSGEKDIRVSSTTWFDIVYPARCEELASILYENADSIYEDISKQYGFPPRYRMPVVICPAVESFNGYWGNGPYNRIVLYDTSMIEDLSVFSETFLSTFRHECIHAYTYNMKNNFWYNFSQVFGDAMSLVGWYVSSGLAEGATVSGESVYGEGRLNDEYAMQIIKQSAIENQFPTYWDVQGSSNIYPTGSYYYFNGAFNAFLQKKYGMEKYAQFWYTCVNTESLITDTAFIKVYGISLDKAWKLFKESLNIPKVFSNPIYNNEAADFFVPDYADFSDKNNAGSLYKSLTVSERGLAFLDDRSDKAYFVPKAAYNEANILPRYLFRQNGLQSVSFSQDGRFLVASYLSDKEPTLKMHTLIYDMDSNSSFTVNDHGLFHPIIVQNNGEYYLVRQSYVSPRYGIQVDKILLDSKCAISGVQNYSSVTFDLNVSPLSFADAGDGTFAYILKDKLDYSIVVSNLNGNVIKHFEAPKQRMVIRYLSNAGNKLCFSWAAPGNMPRLGLVNKEDGSFELEENDISGGVYYPVMLSNAKNDFAYIGEFYRQNCILTKSDENLTEKISLVTPPQSEALATADFAPINFYSGAEKSTIPSKKYNPLPFYLQGYWYPYSALTNHSYTPEYTTSYQLPFGFTWVSSNPWGSNTVEIDAGYSLQTNSVMLQLNYNSGTDTKLLSYSAAGSSEFDRHGWKKATGDLHLYSELPLGPMSFLLSEFITTANFGRPDMPSRSKNQLFNFGVAESDNLNKYLMWQSGVFLGFRNTAYAGPGRYEIGGLKVYTGWYYTLWQNTTAKQKLYNGMDMEIVGRFYIPKLIPIKCDYGVTYNLPSRLSFYLFPSSILDVLGDESYREIVQTQFFTDYTLAAVKLDTLIFGTDIQRATFIPWVFLNDFQVTLSYTGFAVEQNIEYTEWRFTKFPYYAKKCTNGSIYYEDYLGFRVALNYGPNIGGLADSSNKQGIYVEYGITGLLGKHKTTNYVMTIGFNTLF